MGQFREFLVSCLNSIVENLHFSYDVGQPASGLHCCAICAQSVAAQFFL